MTKQLAFFSVGALLLISGCATSASFLNVRVSADAVAQNARLEKSILQAGIFELCSYSRIVKPGEPVNVYIEGDGLAWKSKTRLSDDPTPIHPMVLRLAAQDPSPNVIYIARPGQYLNAEELKAVDPAYWSDRRFSEEVIISINAAIDLLKNRAGAQKIHLIGYSGGAAVAVLVAARRSDVVTLRTLAGNLDPDEVNRIHQVSLLRGSLNPLDAATLVAKIPQRHFTGLQDMIVPSSIAQRFKDAAGASGCIQITPIEGTSHSTGWTERWQDLRALPVTCSAS